MPNPVLARRRFAPWRYVLLARFGGGDRAAPLGSPLTVDVGTLTVTDASNVLSQSGGALVANGTPAANSGINTVAQLARVAGRALLVRAANTTGVASGSPRIGWAASAASGGDVDIGMNYFSSTDVRTVKSFSLIVTDTLGAAPHDLACVMRGTGGFFLGRAGGSGPYKLLWVFSTLTAAEYAKVNLAGATALTSVTLDDFRVVDLGGAWASDYGIATARLAGARSAGDSLAHTANCLLEFTVATLPSVGSIQVAFRQQDTSNEWYLDISSTGAIVLNEFVAAGATSRGSSTGVANGNRVVVIADGTSIKVYVADTSKISYASASNFATATTAQVLSFGTGGAVSDLVAWPRTIALPQGA